MFDLIFYQLNVSLLVKVIVNLGGSEVLKKVEKVYLFLKFKIEGNNFF